MSDTRPYPELLTEAESQELLTMAENLWAYLQSNNLGGYSSGNRPFYIEWKFREIVEQFGRRDTGLQWSKNQLDAHPDKPEKNDE